MALNEKQKRFCEEYVVDLNATQAAIRAGYSEDTADVQGSRLLGNVNVQSYISEMQSTKSKKLDISFEDVVLKFWKFSDKGEKDSDKIKALENVGKLLGFYKEDNKQQQNVINLINLGSGKKPK